LVLLAPPPVLAEVQRVRIGAVSFHNVSRAEAVATITLAIRSGQKLHVCTPNAAHVVEAAKDPEFLTVLRNAGLVVSDGMGVVYASRLLGTALRGNVCGRLLIPELCRVGAELGWRVGFFGASDGVAAAAAARLADDIPGFSAASTLAAPRFYGPHDPAPPELAREPIDLLFVALGTPKQEKWIAHNLASLNTTVAIGIGAGLDLLAGRLRMAPPWATELGVEWVFRIAQEPRRLWRRYLLGIPEFVALVAKEVYCAQAERRLARR